MNKKIILLLIVLVIFGLAIGFYFGWLDNGPRPLFGYNPVLVTH